METLPSGYFCFAMGQVLTPREIISRYIDRNTAGESGTVTVRGVYTKADNTNSPSKQWTFDKLTDELTDATLKIHIPRELREFIKNGDTVEMTGTISDYGFRDSGILQVQMNVTGCTQARDLFVSKVENDRHRVRRAKTARGYKDVRRILSDSVRKGNRPRVLLVYPGFTVADTDFKRAIGDAEKYYEFSECNISFSDPAGVVRVLDEADRGCSYDLVCIVRGGGSGLQNLDNVDILSKVAAMDTPVITAVGHAEDNLFIDSVSDLSKETPSLLGTFFKEIVYEILEHSKEMNEQERRYRSLRKAVFVLAGLLLAAVLLAVYAFNR